MRVFLSYSRADAPFAKQLMASLRAKAEVIDLTSDMGPGGNWPTLLRDRLAAAESVVILLSQKALQSSWLNFEIGAAVGMGKRIVPVILSDPKDIDWDRSDFVLRDLQFVDVHNVTLPVAAERIQKALAA